MRVNEGDLSTFDLEKVNLNALLFQCGYLTITGETTRAGESFYTLDYPNREVRLSLNRHLLAVVFDRRKRNLAMVRVESVKGRRRHKMRPGGGQGVLAYICPQPIISVATQGCSRLNALW